MIKINISILFSLFWLNGMSQTSDRDILAKFVTSNDFCKYILPCDKCNTIVLVDTAGFFKVDLFFVSGQSIAIKRGDYPKDQLPLTKESALFRSCSSLLITNYWRERRKILIQYFHYPTNGVGWISFRIRNKKFKQTGFSYGQF